MMYANKEHKFVVAEGEAVEKKRSIASKRYIIRYKKQAFGLENRHDEFVAIVKKLTDTMCDDVIRFGYSLEISHNLGETASCHPGAAHK